MVAALKSQLAQTVNVGLADWLTLAYHHYTMAVRNTRLVGQEVAALIQWLEARPALPSLPLPTLSSPPLPSSPFSPQGLRELSRSRSCKHPRQESHSTKLGGMGWHRWRWDIGAPSDVMPEPLFCRTVFPPLPPSTTSFMLSPLDVLADLNTPMAHQTLRNQQEHHVGHSYPSKDRQGGDGDQHHQAGPQVAESERWVPAR